MNATDCSEHRLKSSRYCTLTPDGIVEIQPYGPRGETYQICLHEMATLFKFQEWIRHLASRNGYTAEVLGDFATFHARLCDPDHELETEATLGAVLEEIAAEGGLRPPIHRDPAGLARTPYCQEVPDGGLDLLVGDLRYQLSPERIADGPAFAQTLLDLRPKRWFTESVQCDLTNVITARWLAHARGWV